VAGLFISKTNINKRKKHMNTEIKLAVSELKDALPGLTKIIGRSRTLPVLQSVRINRNREGVVTLQATDLDSFITYTARGAQQGPPEEVLVPIEQLTKAVKCSSPKEDIGIVPEAKDKVKLRYNIAGNMVEQTISTLPVIEYPPAPRVSQPGVQVEPRFGQALKEALKCCSDDSSRHVLRGACLDVTDKKFHYIVGTNGRALFSANSFCFTLQKSVIIPDSKFLAWSDFLEEQPAFLSVEPGKEAKQAKDGQPAVEAEAGWVKLESSRWTFTTREIDGQFPNWKRCIPTPSGKWTQVLLSEEAIAQMLLVIPNLPGADTLNSTLRLRVDRCLNIEGQEKDDGQWTSVPVQAVKITGNPVSIALNREYLLKALRFGLNKLEIEDSLTPMVLSKGGKKMVIMPVNLEGPPVTTKPAATEPSTKPQPEQPATPAQPGTPAEERKESKAMSKTAATKATAPEATNRESQPSEALSSGSESPVKSSVEQLEAIKDSLKALVRDLSTVVDTVKAAEKEKRTTDKEIDAVRAKLRQIQNVTI
jgi:DNA polymerase III sliding clamp (beta) subunit (PCNA family)